MKVFYLLFLFILIIPVCLADSSNSSEDLFEILGITCNEKWTCDWNSLNFNKIKPEMNVSSTSNMEAWIDIVGFEGLYKKNNIFYYKGDPINNTIIKYDINTFDTKVTGIQKTVSTYVINQTVYANLNIVLKYCETQTHEDGTESTTYHTESLYVEDHEVLPIVSPGNTQNTTVYIKTCNNTFSPKSWIAISDSNRIMTVIRYQNESIVYYDNVGLEEYTTKGYPFVNFTGESLSEFYDNEYLRKLSVYYCIVGLNFSESDLSVTVHDIYSSSVIGNYTLENETYIPSETFHPIIYYFVGTVLILVIGIYKIRMMYK